VLSLTITGSVTIVSAGLTGAVVAIVALGCGLGVLFYSRPALKQTTLLAAWWWTLAAVAVWSGVELYAALTPAATAGRLAPYRLAAVVLSLCPMVALLGAKRPQHTAWQFVVLSLWGILALPAAEAIFLHRGQQPEVGDARAWLLWVVILLGPINYVPTRNWPASLFVAAGQVVALSPYLAVLHRPIAPQPELTGLAICFLGLVVASVANRRSRMDKNSLNRLWLEFRDAFGLLWGLRVQERVNAVARQNGWDVELTWHGLRKTTDDAPLVTIDPGSEPALRKTLSGLLRRFVSREWIEERMPKQ
jgi:hypothetical protein